MYKRRLFLDQEPIAYRYTHFAVLLLLLLHVFVLIKKVLYSC